MWGNSLCDAFGVGNRFGAEDDVPDKWSDYYKANVEFFEDLGSPGGASGSSLRGPRVGRRPLSAVPRERRRPVLIVRVTGTVADGAATRKPHRDEHVL